MEKLEWIIFIDNFTTALSFILLTTGAIVFIAMCQEKIPKKLGILILSGCLLSLSLIPGTRFFHLLEINQIAKIEKNQKISKTQRQYIEKIKNQILKGKN